MEDSVLNEQEIIQAKSDKFQIIQFTRNFSKDNKQYFPRTTT